MALDHLEGLIVLDEVQRMPEIFAYLRVLTDRTPAPSRFLLLGSASPHVVRGVSESLAGRVSMLRLDPLTLGEVGSENLDLLWLRGGFPRSFLAPSDGMSLRWRDSFIDTFLTQDLPALGVRSSPVTLRRLWTMLAHQHGQIFKRSSTPKTTKAMHVALQDLELDRIDVVHPGPDSWPLADQIRAASLAALVTST